MLIDDTVKFVLICVPVLTMNKYKDNWMTKVKYKGYVYEKIKQIGKTCLHNNKSHKLKEP